MYFRGLSSGRPSGDGLPTLLVWGCLQVIPATAVLQVGNVSEEAGGPESP